MSTSKSQVEKIIDQVNFKNAKRVALVLVIGFACYHAILHVRFGTNSCRWMLTDGRYKGEQEWLPFGCMLHQYSQIDTRKCLRYIAFYDTHTHFVFIGDSRIRDLYYSFVQHLKSNEIVTTEYPQTSENLNHFDNKLKIQVQFIWAPLVSKTFTDYFRNWSLNLIKEPPSVIVMGGALWSIKASNASQESVEEYKSNLTYLVRTVKKINNNTTKLLWALQEPVNVDKLPVQFQMISNEAIDLYNKAAYEVLYDSPIFIWSSIRLVGKGMMGQSHDGIHLPSIALRHNTQILINMYCNDEMNFNDGTCCSSMETYTTLQIVTFCILGLCLLVALVLILKRISTNLRVCSKHKYTRLAQSEETTSQSVSSNYYTLFSSLAKLALIMTYFVICDRSNFFMKENKYYSEYRFWIPIVYITVLGLFFTEDSKYTKVLHQDQLNEWKGWMILVLLVYNITGASRILPINLYVKVLISAYLFLIGYEQFCYVWQRGDVGVVRLFRTLFQLNFMTVTLCLCMNRPYQFYYFVPLLSFWFLVVYCFLALPPHVTAQTSDNNVAQYFYLILKFIVLFVIITILFMSEVFFEKVFVTRPWKALFVTTDDEIHDWWFRWKLDRYSVMYGMSFAIVLLVAQRYNLFDDNNHNNLFSRGIALTATLGAIIGLGCYITFTFLCLTELDCSEIHSYIVFIPIVSYVVLRNISGALRTRYSSFFAWFGEISLELFISQYHIWLAADTHGVLVLIPGYPELNVMITSFIFVCASHEVHRLTKVLLPYAVPLDWKLVLRNFILFLAVLVPIGINDGMF